MTIDHLLDQLTPWLRGQGPENDIVISSRIRLARNLSGYPFDSKMSKQDRESIDSAVQAILPEVFQEEDTLYLDIEKIGPLNCQFLAERQLISREHALGEGKRSVVIDPKERFSLMINEEDHLRLQAVASGLDLHSVWQRINDLDDRIEEHLPYVFGEKLGYLTACPTNVGTGMRVSVMLHLPALEMSQQLNKVFRSLQKVNLAVRGLYGEGSKNLGNFFQISNQITLGRSEEELIQQVTDIIPRLISYERQAREYLLQEEKEQLLDAASRAVGILATAQKISSEEAMTRLSNIRLGVHMKLVEHPPIATINDLMLHIQPAHLQKISEHELSPADRDVARAEYLRKRLKEEGDFS